MSKPSLKTNARIASYISPSASSSYWNRTTNSGGTILKAAEYAMNQTAGSEDPTELYPDVAAVAAVYGYIKQPMKALSVSIESSQTMRGFWAATLARRTGTSAFISVLESCLA